MISEFVEVLLKIFEQIDKNHNPEKAAELINRENQYNKKVLAAAYSWIYDKVIRDILNRKLQRKGLPGFRFLSEDEIHLVGLENYNYLIHFYNVNILVNEDLKLILDQLMLLPEGNVNKEKIDVLIFSLFLDLDNYVLPGSRLLLFSSDKIN